MNYCHIKKQSVIFPHLILILKTISRQSSHQSFSLADYLKHRTEFKSIFRYILVEGNEKYMYISQAYINRSKRVNFQMKLEILKGTP